MSSNKPSSWLDRLRSSKGIPTTNDLNLDQFLSQIPNSDSQIPPPKPNPSPPPPKQEDPKWLNSISSALADLFVMGDEEHSDCPTSTRPKKASRKQPNPKIFIDAREVVAEAEEREKPEATAVEVKKLEEKLDLVGYSRSDLVIIDTSAGWKTEKSVFRKGSVWKVREKKWKGRSVVVGRKKKRKFSKVDDGSDDEKKRKKKRMKMKMKMKKKKMKQVVGVYGQGRIGKKGGGGEHGGLPFRVRIKNSFA